jgi:hypothetical protein
MLADATYRQWTSAFQEGSYAKTDWQEGSRVLFLGPDGDGMVSTIVTHKPGELLSITHLGVVTNGVEDTEPPEAREWAGALENYAAREADGVTRLTIEVDVPPSYRSYFEETWPKALKRLKDLVENDH